MTQAPYLVTSQDQTVAGQQLICGPCLEHCTRRQLRVVWEREVWSPTERTAWAKTDWPGPPVVSAPQFRGTGETPRSAGPNLFSLKAAGTLNNAIPASVASSHEPPVKCSQSKHSEGLRDKEVSSSASEARRPHSFQEHPTFKRNEIKRAQQRHLWAVPRFPVSKNSVPIMLSAVSVE